MSDSDLDRFYRSASAGDAQRPGPAARRAILDRARQLAAQSQQAADVAPARGPRWRAFLDRVPWQIAAPVAAAVLAAILLAPQWRAELRSPRRPVAADNAAGASHPAQTAPAAAPQPARSADLAATQARPTARLAPPAPLAVPPPPAAPALSRESAEVSSNGAQSSPQPRGEALGQAASRADLARSLLQPPTAAINARDSNGRTALMLAVMHDQTSVVRELLARGADPNIADASGHTPLAIARDENRRALISALLAAGAR